MKLTISLLALATIIPVPVNADVISRAAAKIIQKVNAESLERSAREAAEHAAAQAVRRLGAEGAEQAVERGGHALLQAGAKHGDEVWDLVRRAPDTARYVGANPVNALALVRRYGDDAVRMEARLPGLGVEAAELFGKNRLPILLQADLAEANLLLGYARKADSPATRDALFKRWLQHGGTILRELDKHKLLILAGGLTIGVLDMAHEGAEGIEKVSQKVADAVDKLPPESLQPAVEHVGAGIRTALIITACTLPAAVLLLLILSRHRLFPPQPAPSSYHPSQSH